ncbi:MAG TPA: beta-ketoacyl-ACP synthase III, partial [Vicinamibacterales bacterium]|nr:beta-ketoacyl-ACP synthase III [Vicinamibacterales bacterium]
MQAVITGWGYYVPPKVLTNADLEAMVDTSDAWIFERTGIRERHIVEGDEVTSGMAAKAAKQALARAKVRAEDLDAIIIATTSPDYFLPTAACLVQESLGAHKAAVFDLGAACAGFVYGLAVARGLVMSGAARKILLVGAETISRFIDWTDRATCVLFGDGAGAVVIEASAAGAGIQSTALHGDGRQKKHLRLEGGGALHPASRRDDLASDFIQMNGSAVFKLAVPAMADAAKEALATAGLGLEDVDLFVPHQANARIIEGVAKRLGLDRSKVFIDIDRFGNTSAASIPIALCDAVAQGRVRQGDTLVFAAFGGGMT